MDAPVSSPMDGRCPATISHSDATVLVTTRSAAPLSNTAAQLITATYQGSSSRQPKLTSVLEKLMLPELAPPLHIAGESQDTAAVEADADTLNADLQHMSTSDWQDLGQIYDSLSAQDVMADIADAQDVPALAQPSSGSTWQQQCGTVIEGAEAMLDIADHASTGVHGVPHGTAAIDSGYIAPGNSISLDPPVFMETSLGWREDEASLCCHLAASSYNQPLQIVLLIHHPI